PQYLKMLVGDKHLVIGEATVGPGYFAEGHDGPLPGFVVRNSDEVCMLISGCRLDFLFCCTCSRRFPLAFPRGFRRNFRDRLGLSARGEWLLTREQGRLALCVRGRSRQCWRFRDSLRFAV